MTALNWLQEPWITRLGWTLIHFLWQGSLIGLAFSVAQLAFKGRSAQTRHASGCIALAGMLACFVTTFAVLAGGEGSVTVRAMTTPLHEPDGLNVALNSSLGAGLSSGAWQDRLGRALPWLAILWMAGVFALSLQLCGGWLRIQRLRTNGIELHDPVWISKLAELKRRLKVSRPVRLLKATVVEVPTVIGWLQPVILLPATVLTGLTPVQLESILAHELAHIRRNDYLVNFCQRLN